MCVCVRADKHDYIWILYTQPYRKCMHDAVLANMLASTSGVVEIVLILNIDVHVCIRNMSACVFAFDSTYYLML